MMKSKFLISITMVTVAIGFATGFISYRAIAMSEPAQQQWQPLSGLVTPENLIEIVAESTAPSSDRNGIAASAMGYQQGDLLLVDFNTPTLCGVGGCALSGYRPSTGERVLALYVERTSADEPIVEAVDKAGFELPCLLVPPETEDNSIFEEVDKDTLCYQDGAWSIQ